MFLSFDYLFKQLINHLYVVHKHTILQNVLSHQKYNAISKIELGAVYNQTELMNTMYTYCYLATVTEAPQTIKFPARPMPNWKLKTAAFWLTLIQRYQTSLNWTIAKKILFCYLGNVKAWYDWECSQIIDLTEGPFVKCGRELLLQNSPPVL